MTTYEQAEFKKEFPQAYRALIDSTPEASRYILFAEDTARPKDAFAVVIANANDVQIVGLNRQYQHRRITWTAERFYEVGVELPFGANAEMRKLLDSIGATRAEVYFVAAADYDFYGPCTYDVVLKETAADGELKVNVCRVTAVAGTQFRSGRWLAEIL